ncbi:MAG: OsmC family protein [bacterium]
MITLTLNKGLQFIARDELNHEIIVDTNREFGGFDQGIHPIEYLLVALGGCMGMDIVGILGKKGGKIDNLEITVNGQRANEHPKIYEKIVVTIDCQGDYKREDLLRSFELSRDKYCGAYATLKKGSVIEFVIK